jgi:hypothetical protein
MGSISGCKISELLTVMTLALFLITPIIPLFCVTAGDGGGPESMNTVNAWTVQTSVPGNTKVWDNGIHGEGQIIGMGDNGLAYDHECFRNAYDPPPGDNTPGPAHRKVVGYHAIPPVGDLMETALVHGTCNAGMAVGDNSVIIGPNTGNVNGMGMAYKARISFCDMTTGFTRDTEDNMTSLYQPAYDDGARIFTQNIIDYQNQRIYTLNSSSSDWFMWDNPEFLIMTASGSVPGGYIFEPGTGKNVLSVGSGHNGAEMEDLSIFTCNGPTIDNRLKPDLIVPGEGTGGGGMMTSDSDLIWMNYENPSTYVEEMGTGEASSVAAGATVLIRQYFIDGYYPSGISDSANASVPSSALLRAMLVNAAQEMSGTGTHDHTYDIGNGPMAYPNPDQGWGRVVLDNALYFPGDSRNLGIDDNSVGLAQGVTRSYNLTVDDNSVPLEITLAWNDFPSPPNMPSLINNLDLEVRDIGGGNIVYKGNVFDGSPGQSVPGGIPDAYNTAENVLFLIPTVGDYEITVTSTAIGTGPSQPYALVVTGGIGFFDDDFPDVSILMPDPNTSGQVIGGNYEITWNATDEEDGDATLDITVEYSADGGMNWTILENGIANNDGFYFWDTLAVADGPYYKLRINATDSALQTASVVSLEPFAVRNAPLVNMTYPDGGELWMGDSSQMIFWNMSDYQDAYSLLIVDLSYSTDGGMTYPNTIASGLTGFPGEACSYNWDPVDLVDSDQVRIRIEVWDTQPLSNSDESQANFTVDSTAPAEVTGVRAELEGTGVRIYWNASVDTDIDHYEVWWRMNAFDPTGDTYISFLNAGNNTDVYHANIGANNPSSYTYQVRSFDKAGHVTRTTIQAAKYGSTQSSITNPTGWFLLGCPLPQTNTTVEYIKQSIPADFIRLFRRLDGWLSWSIYWSPGLNTLTDIYMDEGFWAHLTGNGRYALAGYVEDKAITLYAGWNLVAYPFAARSMTTAAIEAHLTANCPSYAGMLIADHTQLYQLKVPTGTENIFHLQAFWIHVTADTTWTVINY